MKLLWKTHLVWGCALLMSPALPTTAQTFSEQRDSLPLSWSYESDHYTTLPSDDRWWEGFDDPVLTSLIVRGEKSSADLSMTKRRIEMARLNWKATKGGYYPTIGTSAGWNMEREAGAVSSPSTPSVTTDYFSLGLNFSWEIDVFGRIREQSRLGRSQYNASRAEYQAAMISLCANIATAYVNLRIAQGRVEVARRHIESQENIKNITEARHETGLASRLDVAQALTVLYSTQAQLPDLENQVTSAINSIALLVGCYPDEIRETLSSPGSLPNPFRIVNAGVPADLLRRRPDITRAEYELAGYAAQVGITKKDFLPTLTLDGSVGSSAHRPGDLFTNKSLSYSIAPRLTWTVFEGLARNRRLASAREQMLSGIDNYNLTVLTAVTETENALGSYEASLHKIELMRKVCRQCEEAYKLAVERYTSGLTAFNDVMTAQISLLQNENTLLQTRGAALSALIKVYAAVAGSPGQ